MFSQLFLFSILAGLAIIFLGATIVFPEKKVARVFANSKIGLATTRLGAETPGPEHRLGEARAGTVSLGLVLGPLKSKTICVGSSRVWARGSPRVAASSF